MAETTLLEPIIVLGAVALYGAIHSLTASPSFKRLAARIMGDWYERAYRLIYNLTGGLTLLPILYLLARFPGSTLYAIPTPWLFASLAGQIVAVIVLLGGVTQTNVWHFLGLAQLNGHTREDSTALVVTGLYRYVRHPLYTAGLLFIWLTPVMTTSTLAFNLALSAYIYIGSLFEEQRLIHEYGDDYRRYQSRVPRLIPNPFSQ